ncbi:MAG: M3 family oligoendopeptidase [Chitinophagaceae bacterium]
MLIEKKSRHFLPKSFTLQTWNDLKPYFEELVDRKISSLSDLEQLLEDISEIQAFVSEDACWRQIKLTCDTENKDLETSFTFFNTEIEPHIKPYADKLNKKILSSSFVNELPTQEYAIYLRGMQNEINLFREENISLFADISVLAQQYGAITGSMTVTINEQEYTLQQAAKFLKQSDRAFRKSVFLNMYEKRKEAEPELNTLFNKLIAKRHEVALHAGYANFRDYMFDALGRFDYGIKECEDFHEAVKKNIKPLVYKLIEHKKKALGYFHMYPYDLDAEPDGQKPLEPFLNGQELLDKSIQVLKQVHPYFGDCLEEMKNLKHLDLESRKGKAPGGYNCPLAESGAPFIFMNAAGTPDDVVTMMHESGHAVHSFLCHDLKLSAFKEYPMEIAELASMSMELFSLPYWSTFYPDSNDKKRATYELLERALLIFPWIATIDKFQHWLYTNPKHTEAERTKQWMLIHQEFLPENIEWTGLEHIQEILWQKQLHLFEVPFYYIEYGIAQLGALSMWKAYQIDRDTVLKNYMNALKKGYTTSLPELYKTAGIAFDFSEEYVKNICTFVHQELEKLI